MAPSNLPTIGGNPARVERTSTLPRHQIVLGGVLYQIEHDGDRQWYARRATDGHVLRPHTFASLSQARRMLPIMARKGYLDLDAPGGRPALRLVRGDG